MVCSKIFFSCYASKLSIQDISRRPKFPPLAPSIDPEVVSQADLTSTASPPVPSSSSQTALHPFHHISAQGEYLSNSSLGLKYEYPDPREDSTSEYPTGDVEPALPPTNFDLTQYPCSIPVEPRLERLSCHYSGDRSTSYDAAMNNPPHLSPRTTGNITYQSTNFLTDSTAFEPGYPADVRVPAGESNVAFQLDHPQEQGPIFNGSTFIGVSANHIQRHAEPGKQSSFGFSLHGP